MKDPREIIIQPLLSEKALRLNEEANQYVFKVDSSANKIEIKKAIEKRFSVKVKGVRVVNVKGKPKQRFVRRGRVSGFTAGYKKAFITLVEGDSFDFLDNI